MPLITHLRRVLVAIRDELDAQLHDSRATRAIARIEELRPKRLLFVCLGNVCRSPYAARSLARHLDTAWEVRSAGFIGPGRAPPDTAITAATLLGLDHADHRSVTLTPGMVDSAEAIFVFDRFNVRRMRRNAPTGMDRVFRLGDFDPVWTGKRAIIDPWGKSPEEFEQTFTRIDRCLGVVADSITTSAETGSTT